MLKKILKVTAVLLLVGFSFFYTEKVTIIARNSDPIMRAIKEEEKDKKISNVNPIVNKDEYKTGINGCEIDVDESYNKMRSVGEFKEEKKLNERVICENKEFIAISPFASRFPYQIYILPKKHFDSIIDSSDYNFDFADIVKDVFNRINKLLGEVSFNYVLHTLSPTLKQKEKYSSSNHWFLDIIPKMSK